MFVINLNFIVCNSQLFCTFVSFIVNDFMAREKILFIVNPKSGPFGKTNWIALATKMLAQDFDLEFQYTTHRGHACELAQRAVAGGIRTIVAVGGDGTVNEVASALVGTNAALAILPLGSGNGLARDLRLYDLLPFKAIEAIRHGHRLTIDYGRIHGVPFFCTCGVGFDAYVSYLFADSKRRGFASYNWLCLREYFRYKSHTFVLEHDGIVERRKAFVVNCANIRQFGYNAYIAPQADFQDGLLNITIVKPFGFFAAVVLALRLFTRTIDRARYIETFTCSQLKITAPAGVPFHYDGDPVEMPSQVTVEVVPQGLNVIVPK